MSDELRICDFPATEDGVLAAMQSRQPQYRYVTRWEPPLPPDARVLSVHHDFYSRQFYFRCEHPSFPPHEDGSLVRRAEIVYDVVETPVVVSVVR